MSSASQNLEEKNNTPSKVAPKALPEEKTSTVGLARGTVRERFKESCHLHIEYANKRLGHINGKRPLNSVVSVIATNRK